MTERVEAAMMMSHLVTTMVEAIVDEPKVVKVSADVSNVERITVKVEVALDDVGKVVGKQGRMARSIRAVLGAAAITCGHQAHLDICKVEK